MLLFLPPRLAYARQRVGIASKPLLAIGYRAGHGGRPVVFLHADLMGAFCGPYSRLLSALRGTRLMARLYATTN